MDKNTVIDLKDVMREMSESPIIQNMIDRGLIESVVIPEEDIKIS